MAGSRAVGAGCSRAQPAVRRNRRPTRRKSSCSGRAPIAIRMRSKRRPKGSGSAIRFPSASTCSTGKPAKCSRTSWARRTTRAASRSAADSSGSVATAPAPRRILREFKRPFDRNYGEIVKLDMKGKQVKGYRTPWGSVHGTFYNRQTDKLWAVAPGLGFPGGDGSERRPANQPHADDPR